MFRSDLIFEKNLDCPEINLKISSYLTTKFCIIKNDDQITKIGAHHLFFVVDIILDFFSDLIWCFEIRKFTIFMFLEGDMFGRAS